MSQMESGNMAGKQRDTAYGNSTSGVDQIHYNEPSISNAFAQKMHDDNFIEVLADRLAQRTTDAVTAKVMPGSSIPSAGMRLALAITSLLLLIPLLGIIFGIGSGLHEIWPSLLGAFIVCITVCIVNIVFNTSHR